MNDKFKRLLFMMLKMETLSSIEKRNLKDISLLGIQLEFPSLLMVNLLQVEMQMEKFGFGIGKLQETIHHLRHIKVSVVV